MRKKVWLNIALVMILPGIVLMASCSNTAVQSQPVTTTEQTIQKEAERSAGEVEDAGRLEEDPLWAEVTASEAAERAFINEHIHFAFDSSELSEQAREILNSKADYLRAHPDITITVEGHCDDRGTHAYNISLGKRRAEMVKVFLDDLGISTNRLNTMSYGEERPIAMGHSEASWAKNRRAQFVIN